MKQLWVRKVPRKAPKSIQMKLARRPSIAAFDFDGTITHRDTFVPFLYRVCGVRRVLQSFLAHSLQAGLVAGGWASRDQLKESIICSLLRGHTRAELHRIGREHAEEIIDWCRPMALAKIRWHKEAGHRVILVSASLDSYLVYVAKELGFDDLLCTRLAYDSAGVAEGRIIGKNCRGPEKAVRMKELLDDPSGCWLYAYGDSEGDKELLAIADEPFYRPFHTC
jgi:phosphatidylglycerophosphatase C